MQMNLFRTSAEIMVMSDCRPVFLVILPTLTDCLPLSVLPHSVNLDKQTAKGSTALHYCCLTDNMECLKLLLRGKASIDIGKRPSHHSSFGERLVWKQHWHKMLVKTLLIVVECLPINWFMMKFIATEIVTLKKTNDEDTHAYKHQVSSTRMYFLVTFLGIVPRGPWFAKRPGHTTFSQQTNLSDSKQTGPW